jgi:bacterioferritin-associated ferredoxin
MIVCHCQNISDADIDAAIDWMRASDADTLITPGKVYRALGKSADCGSCMPLFLSAMRCNDNLEIPMQLRNLRHQRRDGKSEEKEVHEGRR